ncbi:MAG: DUF389 domain-containing protein [Jatrophihabitans sp.]
MMQLRVVCPAQLADGVLGTLRDELGAIAITSTDSSSGTVITADVARESANNLLDRLHELNVFDEGMITLAPLDTALGHLATKAEQDAPGEGADAVIWDDLAERTGEDSQLTWNFLAFIVLATLLGAIGVVTDSTVTIVGAMVIGPEFGPLAGLALGLMRRRGQIARRAAVALLVGFPVAIVTVSGLALLGRLVGLFNVQDVTRHNQTEFIYHPGWFSLITALVAGAAGMLSLTSSKSAALVGVFISVTTIPAAGNAAVAAVVGAWHQSGESLLQLTINLVGIVTAGVVTLAVLELARPGRPERRRDGRRGRPGVRGRGA